jgi:hypothetical protein
MNRAKQPITIRYKNTSAKIQNAVIQSSYIQNKVQNTLNNAKYNKIQYVKIPRNNVAPNIDGAHQTSPNKKEQVAEGNKTIQYTARN